MIILQKYDVVVVGGGVAGLTAAIYAIQAGMTTLVIEKQDRLGGRAMTNKKKGAYFNLGAHALYFGDAYKTFSELGLSLKGGKPSIDGYGIWKGKLVAMPTGVKSLFTTPLLSLKGKVELASWFAKLGKLDTTKYNSMSMREWLEENIKDPMLRNIFYALLRTASYVVSPDLLAAGPALQQLKSALKGILYLDRGWGAIVDELQEKAEQLGVHFLTHSKVDCINHQHNIIQNVLCSDGTLIEAKYVIITTSPATAYQLVKDAKKTSLLTWKEQAIEITAACLDVALRKLPVPNQQVVFGIDQTVFLTNQSRGAYLSDDGAQVISLLKYQGQETDSNKDLQDLEQTLDLVQPGWRQELIVKQYLPKMTVSYDFPHMNRTDHPGPAIPEIKGLYVAGEWATHGELLVDAATASAKRAIQHIKMVEGSGVEMNFGYRNII